MKIEITEKPPVEDKHEIEVGNVYDVSKQDNNGVWIIAASGESVKILGREFKFLKEKK